MELISTPILATIQDVPLTPHPIWPLMIALAAGCCYGLVGHQKSNSGAIWGISAAVSALVIATLASGLADGISVPYTGPVRNHYQIVAFVISVVLIALPGVVSGFSSRRRQNPQPGA